MLAIVRSGDADIQVSAVPFCCPTVPRFGTRSGTPTTIHNYYYAHHLLTSKEEVSQEFGLCRRHRRVR
jgi:hypothetical protein